MGQSAFNNFGKSLVDDHRSCPARVGGFKKSRLRDSLRGAMSSSV